MIGAPTPPPGQFGITSVGGGYGQRGISPGGYPAQPQRGGMQQPPAFAPPVPAMGQRPSAPGMNPGGITLGGFPAQQPQNALVAAPQVPGMRSQGQGVNMGQWNGSVDMQAIMDWIAGRPRATEYRTDDGFNRSGWTAARDEWMMGAPWRSGAPAPGVAPGGPAPQPAPFTPPQPPQGMVGQSYNVQGLIPSGSPFQFPTYNFGG